MRINLTLSLLLYLSFFSCNAQVNPELSKDELIEDIEFLRKNLEDWHAGMYRFTSKAEMDNAYDNLLTTIESKKLFQFEEDVIKLLCLIRCGHTRAGLSNSASESYISELKRIPIDIIFIGEEMYVANTFAQYSKLSKGDKILSINGHLVSDIKKRLFELITTDAYIDSFKYKYLERVFWYFYPMFMTENGLPESYVIEYQSIEDNQTLKTTLTGVSPRSIQEQRGDDETNTEPLKFEIKDDYALLTITTFSGSAHRDYYGKLRKGFNDINKAGVSNLIIDLRNNGGGSDMYGATLVSYLAKSNFKYFESIQVTDVYATRNGSVTTRNGINYMTNHRGLSEFEPNDNAFRGNVYVLINGRSFSTTTDVASVLHNNDWATFIGQETAGGYSGNTSGRNNVIELPNSEIRVNVPLWTYYTALKGDYDPNRGIIPDFEIKPTVNDFIQQRDLAMGKALELIKR